MERSVRYFCKEYKEGHVTLLTLTGALPVGEGTAGADFYRGLALTTERAADALAEGERRRFLSLDGKGRFSYRPLTLLLSADFSEEDGKTHVFRTAVLSRRGAELFRFADCETYGADGGLCPEKQIKKSARFTPVGGKIYALFKSFRKRLRQARILQKSS